MAKKVLITGGGGFVGRWLGHALAARGDRVWLNGRGARASAPTAATADAWRSIEWVSGDLTKDADVSRLVAIEPDLVFHLAGVSFVPKAESGPAAAYDVNVGGSARLLHALAAARAGGRIDPSVLVVGSGTQYGIHPASELPLVETAAQLPVNTYAASKVAQEAVALQIGRSSGMRIVCTRSFSHSGIGHAPEFLLPSLAARVKVIAGQGGSVAIGNDVVRDYLHVDDVVRAYLGLAERGVANDVYNVASGTGVKVSDLAAAAIEVAGLRAGVVAAPDLRRASDIPALIGSPRKLMGAIDWRPTRTYRDILIDLITA